VVESTSEKENCVLERSSEKELNVSANCRTIVEEQFSIRLKDIIESGIHKVASRLCF